MTNVNNPRPARTAPLESEARQAPSVFAGIDRTKLYGLLHDLDGRTRGRNVRIMKVGFGLATGPDIHVYLRPHKENPWVIAIGARDKGKRVVHGKYFPSKAEARHAYDELRKAVPDRGFPTKLNYFTFWKLNQDGDYVPDFDAIEEHGPTPSEIDIVFLNNDPFHYAFEAWTAANLKCSGDGRNARRRVDWGLIDPRDIKEAERAKTAGYEHFAIVGRCYTGGCPFPKSSFDQNGKEHPPACKPHGRLDFQLLGSPRIGGTVTYDTTGRRSVEQIYGSLQQIREFTGNGDPEQGIVAGIPSKLVLRPYRTSHNNKPSIQFGVSIEIRAETALELKRFINRHAADFQSVQRPRFAIQQSTDEVADAEVIEQEPEPEDIEQQSEAVEAAQMTSEFYGEFDGEDEAEEEQETETQPQQQQTTEQQEQPQQKAGGQALVESFSAAELGALLRRGRANNWNLKTEADLVELIKVWTGTREQLITALSNRAKED